MGRLAPREEAEEAVLELEDDADAGVEAAEVVRHGREGEVGPLGVGARVVADVGVIALAAELAGGDDLG